MNENMKRKKERARNPRLVLKQPFALAVSGDLRRASPTFAWFAFIYFVICAFAAPHFD
jgi:hypothetical protein